MKDLTAKLEYLAWTAQRLGEKPQFGGDPENDMAPANQHDLGAVLRLVNELAIIAHDAVQLCDQRAENADRTARRQSALLNGMDPDV